MSHPVSRIFEVKHQHRKVENQIKMAKMVLMNELNKQANGLIEELEVCVRRWTRRVHPRSPGSEARARIQRHSHCSVLLRAVFKISSLILGEWLAKGWETSSASQVAATLS